MSHWTITIRELRIWYAAQIMSVASSDYLKSRAFEREEKLKRYFLSSMLLLLVIGSPGRAQFWEPFPGVSSSRKEDLSKVQRRGSIHHIWSVFSLQHSHPCSWIKMVCQLINLQIWGHSNLFLWCSCACNTDCNLCEYFYSCQSVASLFL